MQKNMFLIILFEWLPNGFIGGHQVIRVILNWAPTYAITSDKGEGWIEFKVIIELMCYIFHFY